MAVPYARLSDLGEIDLTFDQEEAPETPKQRKRNAAQTTSEELEMDKRRRKIPVQKSKGRAPPPSSRPSLEDEDVPFGGLGEFNPGSSFDPPPFNGVQWETQLDQDVYGGFPHPPPPPPVKQKSIDDYLPYVAILILLGAGGFFLMKKKSGTNGGEGDE